MPDPPDRPSPAFVALRAAALGIDDLSRQAPRWSMPLNIHPRSEPVLDHPLPGESATIVIAAGVLTLEPRERMAYRQWLGRWTDYSGRIITPHEHARRTEEMLKRAEEHQAAEIHGRKGRK